MEKVVENFQENSKALQSVEDEVIEAPTIEEVMVDISSSTLDESSGESFTSLRCEGKTKFD